MKYPDDRLKFARGEVISDFKKTKNIGLAITKAKIKYRVDIFDLLGELSREGIYQEG